MYTLLTPLFLQIEFSASTINIKLSSLCVFRRFGCFYLIGLLGLMNREIHLARPPSQNKVTLACCKLLRLYLQYILVLRETYKVQAMKYYRRNGINKYMPSVWYLFLCKSTYRIKIHKYVLWNGDTFQYNSQ